MANDQTKSSLLPISGVLIILAALGVTMFMQPLKGARPPVPELRESYEKVSARLWQDPFRAILDGVKDGKNPPGKEFASLASEIKEGVTVLGVMVRVAPYAEETEVRMRLRYAVLSGLSRAGFIPDDAEHIEYIKIGRSTSENITLSNIIPFEWLTHTKNEKDSVLVLWINDELKIDKSPLSSLLKLAADLGLSEKIKFKIIGPAYSSTLKGMVREVSSLDFDQTPINPPGHMEIYSAMATVDNTLLLKDSIDEKSPGREITDKIAEWLNKYGIKAERDRPENKLMLKVRVGNELSELCEDQAREIIKEWFRRVGINFERTIGVDGRLAARLIEELDLRYVGLVDKIKHPKYKNHLILVAEWDTYYGRSFHDVFLEAALKDIPPEEKNKKKPEIEQCIHRISYLRGIDGMLPGESGDKKDEKAEAKSDPLKDTKSLEQPIGKSQYDYLRRLAEEAYGLNKTLQANGKEIKAIGVVGTDFYDKFLVLQALRQRFPDVIFFTTDLDARFLHPDNIKWTRNLVVASNFGLSLIKDYQAYPPVDIQGEVPPFRDNYQTSFFLAVLKAFSDRPFLTVKEKELIGKESEPLIFEIGRHQAFVLTDTTGTIHPQQHRVAGGIWFYIEIFFIILFALIFLFFTSVRVNSYVKGLIGDKTKKRYKVPAVIGALFVVFVVAIYLTSHRPGEEPFSIFEGISVWPTEIFRIIAISLSVLFIYLSWKSRKESKKEIDKQFFKMASSGKEFKTGGWKALLNWIKNVARFGWIKNVTRFDWVRNVAQIDWKLEDDKPVPLKSLWTQYISCDSDQYHVRRVFIIAVFYLLFCILVVSFDIPASPVRGTITPVIDRILLAISVISFVALLSYVFDVTKCCRNFIVAVSKNCSKKSHDHDGIPTQEEIDDQLTAVRLIAKRTDTVGKFIFYPFIVWLVMFVSRFDYFDNWRTPFGLAVVISLGALYAWTSAFLLRRSAEGARTCVADHLKDQLFLTLKEEKPNPDRIKQIQSVLDEVKSVKQGAFAPFSQHPVVQSLLVPFGGVGGVYLIQFLTKMNI